MRIILIAGARPNFMKIAPLIQEIKKHSNIKYKLIHTGQHYDKNMSKLFFNELDIPKPDINLGVGSKTHAKQTAQIMEKLEDIFLDKNPDIVIVVGDVNSTLAATLTASKLGIKIAHVEAGLRSYNWKMPEEINRIITDRISTYLFTTSKNAAKNLEKEGIPKEKIFFVGDVMIDTLLKNKQKAQKSDILKKLNLKKKEYAVLTMHRPENVDDKKILKEILDALNEIAKKIKIVYPIHPRTKKMIEKFGFQNLLKNILVIDPLGYLEFLKLISDSEFVLTDSGGIQEETTILGIPCLTVRTETERPITVEQGTNIVTGIKKQNIIKEANKILKSQIKKGKIPELWDGKASERIINILNPNN